MYVLISPFSKSFDEIGLIYAIPSFLIDEIKVGQIVEIPIKDSLEIGVVLNILETINTNYDDSKIKSIINIKNNNIFITNYREVLLKWVAYYYFTAIHNSTNLFFPKNLREKIGKDKLPELSEKSNNGYKYTYNNKKTLSKEQEKIFNNIIETKKNKILLYGLTGSGKTEIYIQLIKYYIDIGKQILFLIPEIILTNQLSIKISNVFGNDVIIINSTVSDAKKTKYWIDINKKKAKIVVGTRSALFYPYNNLGLIIIDEEHDNSYISDSAPRYNAIEVAEKITELNGNKLVLGTGTPSIKTMYKSVKGELEIFNLLKKYSKKQSN